MTTSTSLLAANCARATVTDQHLMSRTRHCAVHRSSNRCCLLVAQHGKRGRCCRHCSNRLTDWCGRSDRGHFETVGVARQHIQRLTRPLPVLPSTATRITAQNPRGEQSEQGTVGAAAVEAVDSIEQSASVRAAAYRCPSGPTCSLEHAFGEVADHDDRADRDRTAPATSQNGISKTRATNRANDDGRQHPGSKAFPRSSRANVRGELASSEPAAAK
jgi:hypothetical protein